MRDTGELHGDGHGVPGPLTAGRSVTPWFRNAWFPPPRPSVTLGGRMHRPHEGIGDHGELIPGPPWILGHRGSPREAPENTLASLRRALEWGLDGFEYDLHACATGEPVLLHDATLERTTDGAGPVAERTLPELFGVDAGGWFDARFTGEPLPVLEEALALRHESHREPPQHMIELKERGLVSEVARLVRELDTPLSVRVASFMRDVCLEARALGLPSMLLAVRANEDDRRFVRDERLTAYGTGPGGWRTEAGRAEWTCERWSWSVDEPADLLEACRLPLNAFNTNEPRRALAVRAMHFLSPHDEGDYPITVPALPVVPGSLIGGRGEWCGRWEIEARVRNPFPFQVRAAADLTVRRGAFEVEGLPARIDLEPGGEARVPFVLTGGSWRPGGDPLLLVLYTWRVGPGRPGGRLILDAPLHRIRVVEADPVARRLTLLKERPDELPASMTLRRQGRFLFVSIENPGGLEEAQTVVHLDGELRYGGRGLRLVLPEGFDDEERGLPFSCGIRGRRSGPDGRREVCVRRWAGGVPGELSSGVPGRLLPLSRG